MYSVRVIRDYNNNEKKKIKNINVPSDYDDCNLITLNVI